MTTRPPTLFPFPQAVLCLVLGAAATTTALRAQSAAIPVLPAPAANYTTILPPHFLAPIMLQQDNTPADNAVTDAGATLGRVLFYDKRLSANQTVACASCHRQENGFSDPRRFSVGLAGGLTDRNSMGLTNARWYQRRAFFWDERAASLEDQVLQPIQNSVEMGQTLPALVARLEATSFYPGLFQAAFGTPTVTADRISRALAQFVRALASTRTKYDVGLGLGFTNFTAEENLGRRLFNGEIGPATCAQCHGTDNFAPGPRINNNGLENPYVDKGVGGRTGLPQDEGLFKVPSLRNIALTAPYMHDGRFATLEAVIEFYDSGVVAHPNLSPPLRARPPATGALRLNLTTNEKAALVAFLRTLTDTTLPTDARFSDPFPADTLPVITRTTPAQAAALGASISLEVTATGSSLTYQWRKDSVALAGATRATFDLASVAATDAGSYTVVVSNGAGSVTSSPIVVSILPAGFSATHRVDGAGFVAGGTVTVSSTFTYSGALTGLSWSVVLPPGWSFAADRGSAANTRPAAGMTDLAEWSWTTVPASPLTFSFTVNVPAAETTDRSLSALVILRGVSGIAGPVQMLARPDPLPLTRLAYHDADTDRDSRLSLVELTRVIELYNVRNGSVRTGAYAVATTATEDGFAADSSAISTSSATLSRYHTADTSRDGRIGLVELTRVVELYNTRTGGQRTGQYRVQIGTEDNFAPGS